MEQGCSSHIHFNRTYPQFQVTPNPDQKWRNEKWKKRCCKNWGSTPQVSSYRQRHRNGTKSASFSHSENSYSCFGGYGWSFRSAVPPQTLCLPLFMWVILLDSLDQAYYLDLQDVHNHVNIANVTSSYLWLTKNKYFCWKAEWKEMSPIYMYYKNILSVTHVCESRRVIINQLQVFVRKILFGHNRSIGSN